MLGFLMFLFGFARSLVFTSDAGGGQGGQQGQGNSQQGGGQQSQGGSQQGQEQGQQGQGSGQQQQDARFTQADLDRAREQEKQRIAAQQETERKKNQEKELADQQKFKELADQRGAEVEQLRGQAALATTYGERLNTWLENEIKDWPADLKALDPGKDKLEARLDWVEKSRPLAAKLAGTTQAANTEAGAGNRGNNQQNQGQGSNQQGSNQGSGQGGNGQGSNQQGQQRYRFQQPGDVAW